MFAYLKAGRRSTIAAALVAAFLAIPAVAYAARGTTTRADLTGAGYCDHYDAGAVAAVGKVQITTTSPATEGFHPVTVDVKIRGGQLPVGSYQVWLVNLYRDDAGTVVGCSASPVADGLTVKASGADFHGSVDRYTGQYELQVYVGSIPGTGSGPAGSGAGTSPVVVDVA
jgi:hypothetical protein